MSVLISQGYRIEQGDLALNIQDPQTHEVRQVTKDCVMFVVNLGPAGELQIAFPSEHAASIAEGFRIAGSGIVPATTADIPIMGPNGPAQAG